jgi:hypothetical protein
VNIQGRYIERGGLACRKEKARPKPGSSVLPVIVVAVDSPMIDTWSIIVIAGVIVITVVWGVAVAWTVVAIIVGARCYCRT